MTNEPFANMVTERRIRINILRNLNSVVYSPLLMLTRHAAYGSDGDEGHLVDRVYGRSRCSVCLKCVAVWVAEAASFGGLA
jgi:hypothetical protein